MTNFTKSIVAFSCFALSMAACAPAFKGEGINKPNLQNRIKDNDKLLADSLQEVAHIVTVTRGEQSKDGYKYTVGIDHASGLDEKQVKFEVNGKLIDSEATLTPASLIRIGDSSKYLLKAKCLEGCELLVAVLTTRALSAAELANKQALSDEANIEAASGDAQALTEDTKEEQASYLGLSDETKEQAQSQGDVAESSGTDVVTGVIANKDGVIVHQQPILAGSSFKDAVKEMMSAVLHKRNLGMIK